MNNLNVVDTRFVIMICVSVISISLSIICISVTMRNQANATKQTRFLQEKIAELHQFCDALLSHQSYLDFHPDQKLQETLDSYNLMKKEIQCINAQYQAVREEYDTLLAYLQMKSPAGDDRGNKDE